MSALDAIIKIIKSCPTCNILVKGPVWIARKKTRYTIILERKLVKKLLVKLKTKLI